MCLSSNAVENNASFISSSDHDLCLSAKSGVPPGLHNATDIFKWHYGQAIQKYKHKVSTTTSMLR
eukprot:7680162-Karenia_brevis.AAC.1